MASYGMNDVKNGMKIIVDGYPCTIVDTEYVKPGKGQAFTRVKYRNLKTGRVVELTMKSTDSLEAADVVDTDMEYLYSDGEFWHFMHPDTHEQLAADKTAMGRLMMSADTCAAQGLAALAANRAVHISGRMNRATVALTPRRTRIRMFGAMNRSMANQVTTTPGRAAPGTPDPR